MYLATAVAKLSKRGIPKYSWRILLKFRSISDQEMTARTGLFQAGGVSSSITSLSGRGRVNLQVS